MSLDTEPAVEQATKPVGTQALPAGKRKKLKHVCCEHCSTVEDNHAPHTKGCPPETNGEFKTAVAEAVKNQFAITESWQPKKIVKFVINFPGGQTALVKHLDTMDLVRANLIEELDFFTKRLFPKSLDAQGNPTDNEDDATIWTVLKDPEKRCRFLQMTNRLMAAASVNPKIIDDGVAVITDENGDKTDVFGHQVESIDEQLKIFGTIVPGLEEGQCYAGAIDFADRMTFFSELNKPLQVIEPFRGEQNAVLASLEPNESVGNKTERPL